MTSAASITNKGRGLLALYSVNFIGAVGLSLVMPFLVFLVEDFGGNAIVYGMVGASFSFFQLIGAPLIGRYSDRAGRRKALLISQMGTLIAWCVLFIALIAPKTTLLQIESGWLGSFSVTVPLLILVAARSLDGLTGGNISVANAYLVDVSTESDKAQNFGRMASASNLGFILGPMAGGILGATIYREQLPVAFAALVAFIGLFLIFKYLPERKPVTIDDAPCKNVNRRILGKEAKDSFDRKAEVSGLSTILHIKCVRSMLVLYFIIFLAFNLFYTAFPSHASRTLGWDSTQLGLFFAFLSGIMIVVQGPVLKRAVERFGESAMAIWGCFFMVGSFSMFSLGSTPMAFVSAALFALGNGLMWPSFMSILGSLGSKAQQGTIQGFATSAGSLASIIGLLSGGIFYTSIGANTFALGAGVFSVALLTMLITFRRLSC